MEFNLKFEGVMVMMFKKEKDQTLLVHMILLFKILINKTVNLTKDSLITSPKITLYTLFLNI